MAVMRSRFFFQIYCFGKMLKVLLIICFVVYCQLSRRRERKREKEHSPLCAESGGQTKVPSEIQENHGWKRDTGSALRGEFMGIGQPLC